MNAPLHNGGRVPWWAGAAAFVIVVSGIFVFTNAISLIAGIVGGAGVALAISSPAGLMIQVFFMSGVLAGIALLVPHKLRAAPYDWLRMNGTSPRILVAGALGVLGVGFLVDEVTFLLHLADPATFATEGLDYFNRLFANASTPVFLLLTLTVTVGPGVGEELFFRGLVLRSLSLKLPPWGAVLGTAILFGLIHWDSLQGPGAGLIGVYLGFLAMRTGSIWPAVGAHALNNLVCALVARIAPPGQTPLFDTGHPWWLLLLAASITGMAVLVVVRLTRKERVWTERSDAFNQGSS